VSALAQNLSKVSLVGSYRVQSPPGLRKSGMPDSVLMPAPVRTTSSRALPMRRAAVAMSVCEMGSMSASVWGGRQHSVGVGDRLLVYPRMHPLARPGAVERAPSCRRERRLVEVNDETRPGVQRTGA
jgi:hypothetical protein